MTKSFLIDLFGWGIALWLIGYLLGIVLFMAVPPSLVGWIITPIGILFTLWILFKKVKEKSFINYVFLGIGWAVIAIVFDYFFLVKLFHPADGYYKPDVYLYYFLTFLLPIIVGWKKHLDQHINSSKT